MILHSQTCEQDLKAPQIHLRLQTPSYYCHYSVSRGLKSVAKKSSIKCQVNSYYLANYLLCWVLHYQANISCKYYPMFSDTRTLNSEQPPITKMEHLYVFFILCQPHC